jgi:hypothetical protein
MASKQNREFHKYFDTTYKRDYFYEVKTGESHWELPGDPKDKDIVIIDKTEPEDQNKENKQLDEVEKFK